MNPEPPASFVKPPSSAKQAHDNDPFYFALVYPGIGHFLLRRPLSGLFFVAVSTGFTGLFFYEFWIQIRLFIRQAASALHDSTTPLPAFHYGRLSLWLLGLILIYTWSLVDVWVRMKSRAATPPPVPPGSDRAQF